MPSIHYTFICSPFCPQVFMLSSNYFCTCGWSFGSTGKHENLRGEFSYTLHYTLKQFYFIQRPILFLHYVSCRLNHKQYDGQVLWMFIRHEQMTIFQRGCMNGTGTRFHLTLFWNKKVCPHWDSDNYVDLYTTKQKLTVSISTLFCDWECYCL